ncbi:cytochrome P450 [Kibdelosporangium lantanae]
MDDTTTSIDGLPTTRGCPLGPPDDLTELRGRRPIARFTFPDGHRGWLVTGYAQARAILADRRFSARVELSHPTSAGERADNFDPADYPPGVFSKMDPPDHTRLRRQFAGQFTARRMKQLTARIERITADRAAMMLRQGPPADLVRDFAIPVPALVICDLFGVPPADRARFRRDSAKLMDLRHSYADAHDAITKCVTYLAELVRRKRSEPTDDLLSGVVTGGALSTAETIGATLGLLIAGFEATANMLSLGMYALLTHPDQLAALRADESVMDGAVEELLRYVTVVKDGTQRTPLEDVEIDGVTLRAGEGVLIHLAAANRDPARFADPDRLDLARPDAGGHLSLGHGIHLCLGQQLARQEIRIGLRTLLRTFPDLRLAVPADQLGIGTDMTLNGVRRLPVTW